MFERYPHQSATDGGLAFRAARFAMDAHRGQVRKYTGEPYHKHLAEVAGFVAAVSQSQAVVAAAWLHDVLEDTATSYEAIRRAFGTEVASLVSQVTDVSRPEDGNRAKRKAVDRCHLAGSSPAGATIKLADLISNSTSIVVHDRAFASVYLGEKAALLDVLGHGDPSLMALAREVLDAARRSLA